MKICCSGTRLHLAGFAILAALLTGFVPGSAKPAYADFRLCNDTTSLVGVSIGYRTKDGWISEGWWRIPSSSCASLIEGDLSSRFYYVYAEDADRGGQWRGDIFLCTSDKEYKIVGVHDCFARGYEKTGFFEVDTDQQANWLVRLTESGQNGEAPKK